MLSLDQIKVLERKIEAVVSRVMALTSENSSLKQKIDSLEQENQSLKSKVESFESDQEKIEQGIISALDRLNTVENSVLLAAGVFKQEEDNSAAYETETQEDTFEYNDDASDNNILMDDVESDNINNNIFTNQTPYPEPGSFDIF